VPAGEIRFIFNLGCQTGTTILPLGIKYTMLDLISGVNYSS